MYREKYLSMLCTLDCKDSISLPGTVRIVGSRFIHVVIAQSQEVISFLAETDDRSGARKALETLWGNICSMKCHNEAVTEFQDPDSNSFAPLFEPSKCHVHGLCICSGSTGELAVWFHKNLVTLFKPFLKSKSDRNAVQPSASAPASGALVPAQSDRPAAGPPQAKPKPKPKSKPIKKPGRILMEDGFLVLRLEKGQTQQSLKDFESGWDSVVALPPHPSLAPDLVDTPEALALPESESLWFHIGFANYSSWNFSVCRMFVDEDAARSIDTVSEPCPNSIVRLQVGRPNSMESLKHDFKLSFAAFEHCIDDWECEWFASFYVLFTNNDRVQMKPSLVEASPCSIFPKLRVWKARARVRFLSNVKV